jgi:alkane 1-monooxygenase
MSNQRNYAHPQAALPFWLSLGLLPLAWLGAVYGGWTVVLLPVYAWVTISLMDAALGLEPNNADTDTPEADLFWHRLITMIWLPIQIVVIYAMIWWVTHTGHLALWEKFALFFGVGVISGSVGIVYSHELMHQKNRLERWLGDLLLATVLYSHFRSEHLLVHHRYVGTPRDAVSARYNEGFHGFFLRVLWAGPQSAWRAERQLLARAGRGASHPRNPFWRYGALQITGLLAAYGLGGGAGLGFFVFQALVAVWQLELVNYVEHYGLSREYLGEGKYEAVLPRHSWNATHKASNWFLINLQRHSDHHYKPDRRFPLLQTYPANEAPQLPYGYSVMTTCALVPPLWRRIMNRRVRAWRKEFYPKITDWTAYDQGDLPMPKGAS